ncbi:MAG: PCRF domain-containing protein, partial [Planctomycetaceae bacterium]|nr:PCRF domain-containing protein [Planctomycetaceae bacterium]
RRFQQIAKQHADLETLVTLFRDYKDLQKQLGETREILKDRDPEVREMAQTELEELSVREPELESALKRMLLPRGLLVTPTSRHGQSREQASWSK